MAHSTKAFEEVIKKYLDELAANDELFAKKYNNPKKSINDCCSFIVSEVKKMNVQGLSDGEVFYLARHYYEEDNLNFDKNISCTVVVNEQVKLTEKEIADARKKAIEQVQAEEVAKIKKEQEAAKKAEEKKLKKEQEKAAKKLEAKKKKEKESGQMSMFDDLFGGV